ncbi:Mur ligase domain-containing protein, partial [Rubrivirga sp.]|uniref:Mur ligase domain-containing protein n=1 Tax=Rubrivirga sp. TaxID=1885344 RepID=UPI003C7848D4
MAFSTDTRTIEPGDTYVAIRGETHDGHDFVRDAVSKGAVAVVVDHDLEVDAEVVVAEDTVQWLVDRASAFVREVGCDVVGITGSVGKTTTRGAIESVLSQAFEVRSSEGNKNTPLGISLTVLNGTLTPATK